MESVKRYPPLWHDAALHDGDNDTPDPVNVWQHHGPSAECLTAHESFLQASLKHRRTWDHFPPECIQKGVIRPLWDIIRDSLALGQEVALVSLILSLHRALLSAEEDEQELFRAASWQSVSLLCIGLFTLTLIAFYGEEGQTRSMWMQTRRNRLQTRLPDAILLSILRRLLSSVLRTLTASYSSDTVMSLATGGMVVHLLACNYSYANGGVLRSKREKIGHHHPHQQEKQLSQPPRLARTNKVAISTKRPKFKGGTISLNAAFFSITLLASRFHSNALAFIFVSTSIIAFAFYPDARYRMARRSLLSSTASSSFIGISLREVLFLSLSSAAYLALDPSPRGYGERVCYIAIQCMVCLVGPCIMYWLQHHRRIIQGPWDIAQLMVKEEGEEDEDEDESHGNRES